MIIVSEIASPKITIADGPTLNCEDVPEVNLWGPGRAPVARFRRGKFDKSSKPRMKMVGLPVVSETTAEYSDDSLTCGTVQSETETQQGCPCSRLNRPFYPCGEACRWRQSNDTATSAQGYEQAVSKVPVIASTPSLDWPALPLALEAADSWVDCDVSSVASSWLDVDGAALQPHGDDNSEDCEVSSVASSWLDVGGADVMLVSESGMHAHKPAGPLPWSAIVGSKTAAFSAPPASGLAKAPPMSRQLVAKPRNESMEDEDNPDVWCSGHTRRILGTRNRKR